jgi:hypothetical protein
MAEGSSTDEPVTSKRPGEERRFSKTDRTDENFERKLPSEAHQLS